jgi:hypothetical protein
MVSFFTGMDISVSIHLDVVILSLFGYKLLDVGLYPLAVRRAPRHAPIGRLATGNRDYVLKFVLIGDAAVGKSSLLVRLTDQRFLTNPDATVCLIPHSLYQVSNHTSI